VKWAALAVALAAVLPLAGWLRRHPGEAPKIWMLMGFLPFGIGAIHLYMAAISWSGWPGYVKGVEISVLDLLAVAVYLSLPRTGRGLPFRLSMALYFLAVLLSAFQTPVPMSALFYAWQLARMFLIYAVAAKACADERVVVGLLTGMAIGLGFEACAAIWERFGLGILQTGGSLGHQNLLGLMSHFVVFPWFALLLAGERGWRPVIGPLAGLVVAALTVSRATVGLAAAGYLGLFALSMLRKWTSRKAMLLVAGAAVAGILAPVVLSSFERRFSDEPKVQSTYDERAAFENAASMMISDHPMGVGANYYVVIANTGGYNSRAGVAPIIGSDTANVHNIYYLVTAETGYVGLVTFVLMLLQPLIVAFRCGWRNRGDRRGDLLIGLGMALLMVYIHSFFEWIFISFSSQYIFALEAGLVAGLATQLGYWRVPARRRVGMIDGAAPIAEAAPN
jgi:O-antigen ligase